MIDHGRVIAEGTPGELKASVGAGALHVRLLDPGAAAPRPSGCSAARLGAVHLEADPAALSAAVRRRRPRRRGASPSSPRAGIGVADFSLGQPSLDEVFLALTGHAAEDADEAEEVRGMSTTDDHRRPPRTDEAASARRSSSGARPPRAERAVAPR